MFGGSHGGLETPRGGDGARTPASVHPINIIFPINPEDFVHTTFYTFTKDSYQKMVQCIKEHHYPSVEEIEAVLDPITLAKWLTEEGKKYKDSDSCHIATWKRFQNLLHVRVGKDKTEYLTFKYSPAPGLLIPHVHQWPDIVQKYHIDESNVHYGWKATFERLKQVWHTQPSKHGLPISFVHHYITNCICSITAIDSGKHILGLRGHVERRKTFHGTLDSFKFGMD